MHYDVMLKMKTLKKYLRWRYVVPLCLATIVLLTFIDGELVKRGKRPVFVIPAGRIDDGSRILTGLGYTVIDYDRRDMSDLGGGDRNVYVTTGYKFQHWLFSVNLSKTHTETIELRVN